MLKNAYLLAKIGAGTAENEQHFPENSTTFSDATTIPTMCEVNFALQTAGERLAKLKAKAEEDQTTMKTEIGALETSAD